MLQQLTGVSASEPKHETGAHLVQLQNDESRGASLPLRRLLGASFSTDRFLELALAIVRAVAQLHDRRVLLGALTPDDVLVDDVSDGETRVTIADFTAASGMQLNAQTTTVREGSLPYLSPEQTGRTSWPIDERSDLYSLGIVFYEMATGRLPFQASDILGWIHCHLAQAPEPPSSVVRDVPEPISRIIVKLLAKLPEERYQTAAGLTHDLATCLRAWRTDHALTTFVLGTRDRSEKLHIPHKLYGREREIAALEEAFERMLVAGRPTLALVTGRSGIGKSVLVRQLQAPFVRRGAWCVAGKCDQHKRNVPFATIAQAFHELVLQLLAQHEAQLEHWRRQLHAALGVSGQVILDVIPEMELVIGKQPPVPELPPVEAQNRFSTLFRRFIGLFATKDHPLAVFLDDLQWTDPASIALLTDVLTDPQAGHLFVIGAYRDNEVDADHPVMRMLEQVGGPAVTIHVEPLSTRDVCQLLVDVLGSPPDEAAPLATLLHAKTAGNPLFVIQFLASMHEERLLVFDADLGRFHWDAKRIHAKSFTDNVVDLVVGRLRRFQPETQQLLELAACIGNRFPLETLAVVSELSLDTVEQALGEAVQGGLLLHNDHEYRFGHDRVQQAAYALVPKEERAAMHLRIGRRLLAHTPAERLEESVFDIADQLNSGGAELTSQEERTRLAELDLLAARKAKASTAYQTARHYLERGIAFLPKDAWERSYALAFGLHLEHASCAYVTGDFDDATRTLNEILAHARSTLDRAQAHRVQIAVSTTRGELDRGIASGLEAIRLFGVDIPTHPTRDDVDRAYASVREAREKRQLAIEDLARLPKATDPETHELIGLLSDLATPTLFARRNLFCVLLAHIIITSIEHGPVGASVVGYALFGFTLVQPDFAHYDAGVRFGRLAYELVMRDGPTTAVPLVAVMYGDIIRTYGPKSPIRENWDYITTAFRAGVESGVVIWACYACNHFVSNLLSVGAPLARAWEESETRLAFVRKAKDPNIEAIITSQQRFISSMRGLTRRFGTFDGADFDDAAFVEGIQSSQMPLVMCWHDILKIQALYLAGYYEDAFRASDRARELLWTTASDPHVTDFFFYTALTVAALLGPGSPERGAHREDTERLWSVLRTHQRQLHEWAENAPENFADRAALVDAEVARLEGDEPEAMRRYEDSIRAARKNGFVHQEALAYETAARFYRDRGFTVIAETYTRRARAGYVRWGADGKVRDLDSRFPPSAQARAEAAGTLSLRAEQLDLLSVMKAAQTISREIVLEKLVGTLLQVVMEESNAQRGWIVLVRDGELSLEAEASLEPEGLNFKMLESRRLEDAHAVPPAVINYVRRTKTRLVMDDTTAAARFAASFGGTRPPRAIACLPILRQSDVIGLIYLTNDLLTGAFTPDRLAIVELLAPQAAISLENAMFVARERMARAQAEAAERRAAFLVEATASLSESLDPEHLLRPLASRCLRFPADWCTIEHLRDDDTLVYLAGAHVDPTKQSLLLELHERFPIDRGGPHPAAQVLRNGRPLLLADVNGAARSSMFPGEGHADLVARLGLTSALFVPLSSYRRTLGVLVLASATPDRHYGQADLEVASELARRAATAFENADLYQRAQKAIRLRDDFLSVASHELSTPMMSLVLSLQTMLRAVPNDRAIDPEKMRRLFELALRQGDRINRLVTNLLDVSRLELGRVKLELSEVDLAAVVAEIVDRFEPDLARAGCTVSVDATPTRGIWDKSRLDQAVSNLLSNAMKFGAQKPIEIFVGELDGKAVVRVRDHGIGIATDAQSRIFERFERAVSADHYPGLGLGLYITNRIVQAHNGRITVESRPGEGTTFTVTLPRGDAADATSTKGVT